MAGHKALLFLPGYGGIGCEILAAVRETRLSATLSRKFALPKAMSARGTSLHSRHVPNLVA